MKLKLKKLLVYVSLYKAYNTRLILLKQEKILRDYQKVMKELVEATEKKVKEGFEKKFELTSIALEVSKLELELLDISKRLKNNRALLESIVSAPLPEGFKLKDLKDKRFDQSLNKDVETVFKNHVIFNVLSQDVAVSKTKLKLENAKKYPDFGVGVGLSHNAPFKETFFLLRLSVPIPVFNRNQGNIKKEATEIFIRNQKINDTYIKFKKHFLFVKNKYKNLKEKLSLYDNKILRNSKNRLDTVISGYEAGGLSYIEVIYAHREYLENLNNYYDLLLELNEVKGELLFYFGDAAGKEG